jgi:hypothetical protein
MAAEAAPQVNPNLRQQMRRLLSRMRVLEDWKVEDHVPVF